MPDRALAAGTNITLTGTAPAALTVNTPANAQVLFWTGSAYPTKTGTYAEYRGPTDPSTLGITLIDGEDTWTDTDALDPAWSKTIIKLGVDRVNNNATANTIASITDLSFPVIAGVSYRFAFTIRYDAAATTTGSRFALNGPAVTALGFIITHPPAGAASAAAAQILTAIAYNSFSIGPAIGAFSPFTTGNTVLIEGTILPSASGTVQAMFASEVASSAITVKAGSMVEVTRLD